MKDELQWMDDIIPGVHLETETIYAFVPPLDLNEMYDLRSKIRDEDGEITRWFKVIMDRDKYKSLRYFHIGGDEDSLCIKSWCFTTDPITLHNRSATIVNGRELIVY